jgi:hypothetical protein
MSGPGRAKPEAKVRVRCLCGHAHAFSREKLLERLGRARWKCAGCKRRFVVACTPGTEEAPERFWPIFLEEVPPTGDTQEMALASDGASRSGPPPQLQFRCRCGCRLVGEARLYGSRTRCPRCHARLIVRVGYDSDTGKPIPLLEFVESEQGETKGALRSPPPPPPRKGER